MDPTPPSLGCSCSCTGVLQGAVMVTALYSPGAVCFTPRAAWGQQWQRWELTPEVLNLAEPHPVAAPQNCPSPPEKHNSPCRNQGFPVPNLSQVTLCIPQICPTCILVCKQGTGWNQLWWEWKGWDMGGKSYGKSWNVKAWRAKHCLFLCRKWKALVDEEQIEDSQMLKWWICKQKNRREEIHSREFQ